MKLNRVGKKYGGYLVLEHLGKRTFCGGSITQVWKVQCHCGTIKEVGSSALRRKPHGCGCTSPGKRKPDSFIRALLQKTKYSAKTRDYGFSLTEHEFKNLITKNCHYCGREPQPRPSFSPECVSGRVPVNGLDRVDNTVGYTQDNCVPCCEICNRMKLAMGYSEFIEQIKKIYDSSIKNNQTD